MPIEIRELVIRATVATGDDADSGASGKGSNNSNPPAYEEIINACVEKILEILKEKNER